jgi:hypothetical protein
VLRILTHAWIWPDYYSKGDRRFQSFPLTECWWFTQGLLDTSTIYIYTYSAILPQKVSVCAVVLFGITFDSYIWINHVKMLLPDAKEIEKSFQNFYFCQSIVLYVFRPYKYLAVALTLLTRGTKYFGLHRLRFVTSCKQCIGLDFLCGLSYNVHSTMLHISCYDMYPLQRSKISQYFNQLADFFLPNLFHAK